MSMMTSIIGLAAVVLVISLVVVALLMRKPAKKPATASPRGPVKPVVEETPSGTQAGLNTGGAVMPGATAVVRAPAQPRENPQVTQLRQYVGRVMSQGYTPDQINAHLQESGWDAGTAERIINEVYQDLMNRSG